MSEDRFDRGLLADMREVYAEKIKTARKQARLTQKELAERTGLSYISIRRIENGECSPRLEDIQRIFRVLNPEYDPMNSQIQAFPKDWSDEQLADRARALNEHSMDQGRKSRLLSSFDSLNTGGQDEVIRFSELMEHVPEYKK